MYFKSYMLFFILFLIAVMTMFLIVLLTLTGSRQITEWPSYNSDRTAADENIIQINNYVLTDNRLSLIPDIIESKPVEIADSVLAEWIGLSPDRSCISFWQQQDNKVQLKLLKLTSAISNPMIKSTIKTKVNFEPLEYFWKPVKGTTPIFTGWADNTHCRVVVRDVESNGPAEKNQLFIRFYTVSLNEQAGTARLEEGREYAFPLFDNSMDYFWSLSPDASWFVLYYQFPNKSSGRSAAESFLFYSDGFSGDHSLPLPGDITEINGITWTDKNSFILKTKSPDAAKSATTVQKNKLMFSLPAN
jgi:hypothetical protein